MPKSRLYPALAACALLLGISPAHADETDAPGAFTLSGNAALVSDYRFRGVSQSGGDAAVQGSLTLTHASGLYLSGWASSVSFDNIGAGPVYGSAEVDVVAGWSGELASGVTLDAGIAYYAYPGGHVGKAEFFEPFASLSTTLGPATLKLGGNYAWKQGALGGGDNVYVYGDVDVGVPGTPLTLTAHAGRQDGPMAADVMAGRARASWDWSIGAKASVAGRLTLGLAWTGNDAPSIKGLTDDRVVGTLTVGF